MLCFIRRECNRDWKGTGEEGGPVAAPVGSGLPRPAEPPESSKPVDNALFVVEYAEESYIFWNGTRMRFGRDDDACQIPIWEEINRRTLSKVAGELWCANDQMWARNLSAVHEIVVTGAKGVHALPPRRHPDPGHACSVPIPRGRITAPSTGEWSLEIKTLEAVPNSGPTVQVENIPDGHRTVADALCAPILAGGRAVATYSEIALRTGWSERVARRRVEELCNHYAAQIGGLPGGRLSGETQAQALARILVARNKFAVPRIPQQSVEPIAPPGEPPQ